MSVRVLPRNICRTVLLASAVIAIVWPAVLTAQAPDFYTGVEYVCSGDRISAKCAYGDNSDAAKCQLEYHNRKQPSGALVYKSMTRGEVRKLFATCTPPSAGELADKAREDAVDQRLQTKAVQAQHPGAQQTLAGGGSSDPGTLAMRNCAAAGRDLMQCLGEAVTGSLRSTAGGAMPGVGKALSPGLRMTGRYGADQLGLTFNESQVLVVCGGGAYSADYSVARTNAGQIMVAVTPDAAHQKVGIKPFNLVVQPTGMLSGSGGINTIAEKAVGPAGPQNVQTSRHYLSDQELQSYSNRLSELRRDEAGNIYVNVQQGTLHTASMVTCNISNMPPTGSAGNTSASQALGQAGSMMSSLLGQSSSQTGAAKKPWPGPGLRLTGAYVNGALGFEFHEESVVVACGRTMDARSYAVQQSASQVLVRIENQPQPIMLSLLPNGTLTGSGPIQITGHSFVGGGGSAGSPYTASSSAKCTLGTLLPRG